MSVATTCSISGSPTIDPVISLKTGHVFEKSTVLKHISVYGTCPHTHQALAETDLLPLANSKNTGIPAPQFSDSEAIIKKIQTEYEAMVLETSELKKHVK